MVQTIREAVGNKTTLGKPAPNRPEDVKVVQELLKQVLGSDAPVFRPGICDETMKNAIATFQRSMGRGTIDSTVEPRGGTLANLNRVASPLILNPITLKHIALGGYTISYRSVDRGAMPGSGYTLTLQIGAGFGNLLVTNRPADDLIGVNNLPDLLRAIGIMGKWANDVECRLILRRGAAVVSTSEPAMLSAPVKPYEAGLGMALLDTPNVVDMTYAAHDPRGLDGRYLWVNPIDGKYYFAYGCMFETDAKMRGLVCITYVGAVYGVDPNAKVANANKIKDKDGNVPATLNVMSAYGSQLSTYLNAKPVGMEAKREKDIVEFFKQHTAGTYIMFSAGHTTLVVDGRVHEFKPPNGYNVSEAACDDAEFQFNYGASTWWVRELNKPTA